MYRVNTITGAIHFEDGRVIAPPYNEACYLEYAAWVQAGNTPEEFAESPAAPVPEVVSRFKARAALYQAGLLESVEQMMASPETPMIHRIAWQDVQEFNRSSALVAGMGQALGLSSEQIDDLFRLAATITA